MSVSPFSSPWREAGRQRGRECIGEGHVGCSLQDSVHPSVGIKILQLKVKGEWVWVAGPPGSPQLGESAPGSDLEWPGSTWASPDLPPAQQLLSSQQPQPRLGSAARRLSPLAWPSSSSVPRRAPWSGAQKKAVAHCRKGSKPGEAGCHRGRRGARPPGPCAEEGHGVLTGRFALRWLPSLSVTTQVLP